MEKEIILEAITNHAYEGEFVSFDNTYDKIINEGGFSSIVKEIEVLPYKGEEMIDRFIKYHADKIDYIRTEHTEYIGMDRDESTIKIYDGYVTIEYPEIVIAVPFDKIMEVRVNKNT